MHYFLFVNRHLWDSATRKKKTCRTLHTVTSSHWNAHNPLRDDAVCTKNFQPVVHDTGTIYQPVAFQCKLEYGRYVIQSDLLSF